MENNNLSLSLKDQNIPKQARGAKSNPFLGEDVNEMKANKKPQEILKLTLDAIAIYFSLKLLPIGINYDL